MGLRKICEQCKDLRVVPEEGKEYAAVLVGRNLLFVDPTSSMDKYSPQLWADFARYVLSDECGLLPASRYDAASVLRSRELPFLRGYSLGQLCHIVQLAISHKSILGHKDDGHLVPYLSSLQHAKEVCAMKQEMFSNIGSKTSGVKASMEECLMMLKQLLFEVRGPIMASSLKRLFQERFNYAGPGLPLGRKRLFELLQDPRMQGISLHGHQNGQLAIHLDETVCMAPVPYLVPVLACQAPTGFSVQQSNVSNVCNGTSPTARSSIAINISLPELRGVDLDECVSPGSTPRCSHSPIDMESQEESPLEFCLGKDSEEQSDTASTGTPSSLSSTFDDSSSVGTVVKNTFLELAEDNASSCEGNARRRTQSEPRRVRV